MFPLHLETIECKFPHTVQETAANVHKFEQALTRFYTTRFYTILKQIVPLPHTTTFLVWFCVANVSMLPTLVDRNITAILSNVALNIDVHGSRGKG